ncbi:hypothetical protein [Sphingobium nicotianae]|uniref:Uncharacterized protein n=1 Tax=Sphingobium nicotianae TaxID=2782607 RepID=A0A9X1IS69_9SPHN|nr:hypothetical protein [Sphingobium nicotianae]MBT2188112.1 hypothetical protein [Sphingobium nicotianae]
MAPHLEFRIPISPTDGFFAQVRLFNFALRRLGGPYAGACLRVVIGDHCDLDAARRANPWSECDHVIWDRVPDAMFEEADIWGTANWRLSIPAGDADIVILSDADTVMLRDIDPLFDDLARDEPMLLGHMAHYPPPINRDDIPGGLEFWPAIFDRYGAPLGERLHRYSMDVDGSLPLAPAYFNLGFVAMNRLALEPLGLDIHWTDAWLKRRTGSHMRCQIALPLIAHRRGLTIKCIDAAYNSANDPIHYAHNNLAPGEIRVLHYLRETELDRRTFLLPSHIDAFLARDMTVSANRDLQQLVRLYRETL